MESYLQDSLKRIFVAVYVRTFDDRVAFTKTLQQQATFRATVRLRSSGDLQGHALRKTAHHTVTMPTCDVLLRHFSKMMLYMGSIRVAYTYLLYTLGNIFNGAAILFLWQS